MAFNELEAAKMVDDGKLTDKEIKLLTRLRNGLAEETVREDKEFESLTEKGLVMIVPLSHPRADISVDAVVPTEAGVTVLNMFDKRFRENTAADADANTAPDVDPKLVKAPTAEEARHIPSLDAKPLDEKDKPQPKVPEDAKKAMKDPLVKTGAKDISDADTDNKKK